MITLRSFLFLCIFFIAIIVCSIYVVLFGKWVGRSGALAVSRSWSHFSLGMLKRICGLDYQVSGLENIPNEPCILMCKHQSTWETVSVPGLVPRSQVWVLKQELMQIPLFGRAMRIFEPIALDRKAIRQALRILLQQGQRHLKDGYSILVFPEGTRVAVGEVAPFNIGGALLAEKSGAPVIPIAHNAGVFWKRRALHKLPGRIDMIIGPAIDPSGRSAKEINALASAWINETVASLAQKS